MSDKQRDPKTGRFVKNGLGIPVRDADDEVIDNLKERLAASASRVSYLEKVVKEQDVLIEQLQIDAMDNLSKVDVVERTGPQLGEILTEYMDDSSSQDMEVPEPKRGYRLIAWGLIIGGCILFWWGFWQVVFGGK